jgi:proteasome lid subunit RPN8/RPN11
MELVAALEAEVVAHARACLPEEACGLVAGKDGRAARILPMRNLDRSASTYRLDPVEQLAAFDEIEREGFELLAIYHSHPSGPAEPSDLDRRLAFYPDARYLIVSLADPGRPEVRAFRIADGAAVEEAIER